MRRNTALIAVLLILMILWSTASAQPRYPDQQGHITDAAAVLSKETVEDLMTLSKALSRENTLELYVATVDFFDGYTLSAYVDGLRAHWDLDDEDLLLLLCVGEDLYALAAGEEVEDKISSTIQRKLLSSYLDVPFMRQQYDNAIAAFMPALVTEINKAYRKSIDITGLFGIAPQPVFQQDRVTHLTKRNEDLKTALQSQIKKEDDHHEASETAYEASIETGLSVGKVILIVLLLLLIFGYHGPFRQRYRRGCGCGCAPFSGLLAALGLWRFWKHN